METSKSLLQELSAHRHDGWVGQYNRIIRWVEMFKQTQVDDANSNTKSHYYFDIMFASFQNIFFLKDWLINDNTLSKAELNQFINDNIEIGICRDICNGTKHFDVDRASVDSKFSIIRQYDPFRKRSGLSDYEIIICAGGYKYTPYKLMTKCVELYDALIEEKLNLKK